MNEGAEKVAWGRRGREREHVVEGVMIGEGEGAIETLEG